MGGANGRQAGLPRQPWRRRSRRLTEKIARRSIPPGSHSMKTGAINTQYVLHDRNCRFDVSRLPVTSHVAAENASGHKRRSSHRNG